MRHYSYEADQRHLGASLCHSEVTHSLHEGDKPPQGRLLTVLDSIKQLFAYILYVYVRHRDLQPQTAGLSN